MKPPKSPKPNGVEEVIDEKVDPNLPTGEAAPRQTRRGGTTTTNRSTNAWSARERGIRGRDFSGPSTYMTIGKQESALGNVGGATVSF